MVLRFGLRSSSRVDGKRSAVKGNQDRDRLHAASRAPGFATSFQSDSPHGAAMATDDTLGKSDGQIETIDSSRGAAGFTAGLLLGVVLGAAVALLFAPEQGEKTRGRLRRRVQSL